MEQDGGSVQKKTAGIDPATAGALHVLQFARPGTALMEEVERAAREVSGYHESSPEQLLAYNVLTDGLTDFLIEIVRVCPPGPERSTAIQHARAAKYWAAAAVALEGR